MAFLPDPDWPDLNFIFRPTWGNYLALQEMFGGHTIATIINSLKDEFAGAPSKLGALDTPIIRYLEFVSGKTIMPRTIHCVSNAKLELIRTKFVECVQCYMLPDSEFEKYVKSADAPPGDADASKKNSLQLLPLLIHIHGAGE